MFTDYNLKQISFIIIISYRYLVGEKNISHNTHLYTELLWLYAYIFPSYI